MDEQQVVFDQELNVVKTRHRAAEWENDALKHVVWVTPQGIDPMKFNDKIAMEREGMNMSWDFSEQRISDYTNWVDSWIIEQCEDV